jgi:hypothetical protein
MDKEFIHKIIYLDGLYKNKKTGCAALAGCLRRRIKEKAPLLQTQVLYFARGEES